MPVYVYRNLTTNETFEFEQRMTEPALSVHPQTGDPVKRLIQPVGIAFKGSGFYVTDSKKQSNSSPKGDNKGEGKSEGKAEGKSEGKAEGKSEAKAEAKTETKSEKKSDAKKD